MESPITVMFSRSEPLTDLLDKQLAINIEFYQFASWFDGDECGNHNLLIQTTLSGSERVNLSVNNTQVICTSH